MQTWKFIRRCAYFMVLFSLLLTGAVTAAPGDYLAAGFNGFNEDGIFDAPVHSAAAVQLDGKLVVAALSNDAVAIGRMNPDGTIDQSFGDSGTSHIIFPVRFIPKAIGFQSDGKIILVGNVTNENPERRSDFAVARLLANGERDFEFEFTVTHFEAYQDTNRGVYDVEIQPDDKIIAIGTIPVCGIILCGLDFGVVRYLADGQHDASFDDDGLVSLGFGSNHEVGFDIDLQKDGKLVLFGTFESTFTRSSEIAVARLHPDGKRDSSFGGDGRITRGGITDNIYTKNEGVVFENGKMVVSGDKGKLMGLKPNGAVDKAFGQDGILTPDTPFGLIENPKVAIQANGNLLVVGAGPADFVNRFVIVASFTPDGQELDASFGVNGAVRLMDMSHVFDVEIGHDGRIMIHARDKKIVRLHTNGQLDLGGWVTTDISPTGARDNDVINDMVIQPDGKIAAIGNFEGGQAIARYQADGHPDEGWRGTGLLTYGITVREYGYAIASDSANRLYVVVGYDRNGGNDLKFVVRRYKGHGVLDYFSGVPDSFPVSEWGGTSDIPATIKLLPDGGFIVAGHSNSRMALTRYTADGLPDSTFDGDGTFIESNTDYFLTDIAVQPDGKIIIVGKNGANLFIGRLLVNGQYDSAFGPLNNGRIILDVLNSDREFFSAVAVQTSGRIIAMGTKRVAPGHDGLVAVRFNSDGSRDNDFGDGGFAEAELPVTLYASDFVLEADGSLMIAGCANTDHFMAMRFLPNGSPDNQFGDSGLLILEETPTFGSACAQSLAYDPAADNFVLGGHTKTKDGGLQFALARINRTPSNRSIPSGLADFYETAASRLLTVAAPGVLSNA